MLSISYLFEIQFGADRANSDTPEDTLTNPSWPMYGPKTNKNIVSRILFRLKNKETK